MFKHLLNTPSPGGGRGMRRSVSTSDETRAPRRVLKTDYAQRSTLDELRGVSSGDETLCRRLDITSQTNDLKMSIFSSDFQPLIKH